MGFDNDASKPFFHDVYNWLDLAVILPFFLERCVCGPFSLPVSRSPTSLLLISRGTHFRVR